MTNGQIKGVGNLGKGARIGYMKKFNVLLILVLISLSSCGDDDHTDEWVERGRWKCQIKNDTRTINSQCR